MRPLIFFAALLIGSQLFAQTSLDTLVPKPQIVGEKGSYEYSVMYPLGWSRDGKFAFVFQHVNGMGGAAIYNYQFIIQGERQDQPVYSKWNRYDAEYSDQYDFVEEMPMIPGDTLFWGYPFFRHVYWKEQKDSIQMMLSKHKIWRDTTSKLVPLDALNENGIQVAVEVDRDTTNAIQVDRKIDVYINAKGKKRAVYSKTNALNEDMWAMDQWGNYTDLLYYKVEGCIRSPYSDHYILYMHQFSMGFEEPAEYLILIPFSKNH